MSWENSMCLSIVVHSLRQEEKYFIKYQWRLSVGLVVLKCSEPVFAEKKLGVHSWRWQTTRSCFALEPCHNHRGKAPLTPASGLPIPSPKTGLTTQKLTAAQVPGNYKFKLPGYKALIQVQAGNIILSHIQSIVVAMKRGRTTSTISCSR